MGVTVEGRSDVKPVAGKGCRTASSACGWHGMGASAWVVRRESHAARHAT